MLGLLARTAMTSHAVLEVGDAFLAVLALDIRDSVLMAAVAGIAAEHIAEMAGRARCVVVTIEQKMFFMREGGRRPGRRPVALCAAGVQAAMQVIDRCLMAALAALANRRAQQLVREGFDAPLANQPRAAVIAVASHAVLLDQLLMKRQRCGAGNRFAGGGTQADVGHRMTAHTALGRHAAQGCMTGEAVGRQAGMGRHQRAGADHQSRIDEGERDHADERHRDQ